ncbi:MAG: hypothetical protein ACI8UP_005573 [Porticoccaceae bacterium]|jgi:hypothetical protein
MPKIISDKNERQIAQLVRNWPTDHSLNWNSICLGAQEILGWGAPPTRQALNKKLLIKSAYKAKKGQLKSVETKLDGMSKPRSTAVAGAECNTVIELKPEHHAASPWHFA